MSTIQARRFTRIGRTAAAALGLSAATLWALNVPIISSTLPPPPAIRTEVTAPSLTPAPRPEQLDRQSLAATADRLALGANVKAPEPPPVKAAAVEEPPPPAGPEWQYLGQITEPDRRLALVSVDGHQRVIPEGQRYGETRLVSITPASITIHDGSGQHRLDLAPRGEARVAWLRDMPASVPPGNNMMTPATAVAVARQAALAREARQRVGYRTFREREDERRGRNRPAGPQG